MANQEKLIDSPLESELAPSFKALPKEEGGYPCEFVEPPPSVLTTECAICLQVPREPQLISCCGHNFCRTCIEPVHKAGRPCPLCNEKTFTFLHNKGLQRSLNELRVRCAYQQRTCEWTGELRELEEHLNENPEPEKQLVGCEFVELQCIYKCGARLMRFQLDKHQRDLCPQRPYLCDYCREYTSIHADVIYRHWPVCKCYPLSCPNDCRVYAIERQNMEEHLSTECPLKVIECEFQYAGCDEQVQRQDMDEHLSRNHLQHTSLLAAMNQKLAEDLLEKDDQITKLRSDMLTRVAGVREEGQQKIAELTTENTLVKLELSHLRAEVERIKDSLKREITQVRDIEAKQEEESKKVDESLDSQITDLRSQFEASRHSLRQQCHSVQAFLGLFPVEFIMNAYDQHVIADDDWQSPPFYSHLQGYKLCIIVNANGNGLAREHYMSVYACLMRGEFDSRLKWPFHSEITIQLLNQLGDRNHATGTIRFTERSPDMHTSRVTEGERMQKGWGLQEFIAHDELGFNSVKNRQYLKNDCLCFRVVRVRQID